MHIERGNGGSDCSVSHGDGTRVAARNDGVDDNDNCRWQGTRIMTTTANGDTAVSGDGGGCSGTGIGDDGDSGPR